MVKLESIFEFLLYEKNIGELSSHINYKIMKGIIEINIILESQYQLDCGNN